MKFTFSYRTMNKIFRKTLTKSSTSKSKKSFKQNSSKGVSGEYTKSKNILSIFWLL